MTIKDYLHLAGEQGKVVIVDAHGKVQGVLLPYDEYKKIAGNVPQEPKPSAEDMAEKVNREVLQAQLEEVISSTNGGTASGSIEERVPMAIVPEEPPAYTGSAERIDSLISKRAQDLFKSVPYNYTGAPQVSNEAQDEEISTNFDDI